MKRDDTLDINIDNVPDMSGIYIIKCIPNKKIYIGSTGNLKTRLKTYKSQIGNRKLRIKELNDDIEKYGINNIQLDFLCTCDYEITTILENYYIRKYNSILQGYNKINSSKKNRPIKYRYNTNYWRASIEENLNRIMKKVVIDIFDFTNSANEYIISVEKLICILEEIFGEFDNDMCFWVYEIFRRLDLSVFLRENVTGDFYEISGNQFLECRMFGEFKTDQEININVKRRLKQVLINEENMYVECPKYIRDNSTPTLKLDKFRRDNIIIDATYKQEYSKCIFEYDCFYWDI